MFTVDNLPGLRTWTVIPFAHFQRGNRHVIVAWPAINSRGQLVDATVVGICLVQDDSGALVEEGRRWVVRDVGAARSALQRALGGSDYELVEREAGVPLDRLGPILSGLGTQFAGAVAQGNRQGARATARNFAALLPVERVAFENGVAQLLWMAARHRGRLEHVRTVRNGDEATLTLDVMRGRRRMRTIRARAREEAPGTDRWVIVSYQ
jgi:hypothetical protein